MAEPTTSARTSDGRRPMEERFTRPRLPARKGYGACQSRPATQLPGPLAASFKTAAEMLPAMVLAAAFLIAQAFGGERVAPRRFVAAAACYAFTAAIVVLFCASTTCGRLWMPQAWSERPCLGYRKAALCRRFSRRPILTGAARWCSMVACVLASDGGGAGGLSGLYRSGLGQRR